VPTLLSEGVLDSLYATVQ
jgi:hypothetical protein